MIYFVSHWEQVSLSQIAALLPYGILPGCYTALMILADQYDRRNGR